MSLATVSRTCKIQLPKYTIFGPGTASTTFHCQNHLFAQPDLPEAAAGTKLGLGLEDQFLAPATR